MNVLHEYALNAEHRNYARHMEFMFVLHGIGIEALSMDG